MPNRTDKTGIDQDVKLNKARAGLAAEMAKLKARREAKRISLADLKAAAIKRRSGGT